MLQVRNTQLSKEASELRIENELLQAAVESSKVAATSNAKVTLARPRRTIQLLCSETGADAKTLDTGCGPREPSCRAADGAVNVIQRQSKACRGPLTREPPFPRGNSQCSAGTSACSVLFWRVEVGPSAEQTARMAPLCVWPEAPTMSSVVALFRCECMPLLRALRVHFPLRAAPRRPPPSCRWCARATSGRARSCRAPMTTSESCARGCGSSACASTTSVRRTRCCPPSSTCGLPCKGSA
jgi:hypothetical protein